MSWMDKYKKLKNDFNKKIARSRRLSISGR